MDKNGRRLHSMRAAFNRAKLADARERKGWSRRDLAEVVTRELARKNPDASVSHWSIAKYEAGHRSPRAPVYGALCRALNLTRDELILADREAA